MNTFNSIVYFLGAMTTVLCIVLCLVLFFSCKSRDKNGRRIELDSKSSEKPWSLGTWIAGVFVAGTGVALMYAPGDLVGYVQQGLNPMESITMVALLNGAPVWAMYSVVGLWYMKHMDSKIGKIAAMLFRYATYLGLDTQDRAGLEGYADGSKTSAWAVNAMEWAVSVGLFKGDDNGNLNPGGNATRAEVATLLQRMIGIIVK